MTTSSAPKRVLPIAVVGARTNTGAIFEVGCSTSKTEICNKTALRVGDKLMDPLDGEVTIISGLDKVTEGDRQFAGLGSVLSNNSYIVDAGQDKVYWVEFDDGNVTMFIKDDGHAA